VGLGGLVDLPEQTTRSDVDEPCLRVDGHLAHAGQVEGQAARRHGGPGDVVAPALDAEQQPVVAGQPDRGGDVLSRGRLEDDGWEPGRHAVPDGDGIVPTLLASAEQPALDPRVQVIELLGGEADGFAVEPGELDGVGGGHVRDLLQPGGCPLARPAAILQTPVKLYSRLEYVKRH
jgi:hypothetical protein